MSIFGPTDSPLWSDDSKPRSLRFVRRAARWGIGWLCRAVQCHYGTLEQRWKRRRGGNIGNGGDRTWFRGPAHEVTTIIPE